MIYGSNRYSLILLSVLLLYSIVLIEAYKLRIHVQPETSTGGDPFAVDPVVVLTDNSDIDLDSVNVGGVLAVIGENPNIYGVVEPSNTIFPFVNGVATLTGLYIDLVASDYTLIFISISHGVKVESNPFDIIVGDMYGLALITDISTAYGGTPFRPQPIVAVVDRGGNVVDTHNDGTITVVIKYNPTGGNLLPVTGLTATIGGGMAKFQAMYIDVAGSPYVLEYTADFDLPAGSVIETNPFTVAAGSAAFLVLSSSPSSSIGGKAFGVQPVVEIRDAGNNLREEDSSSFVRAYIGNNPSGGTLLPSSATEVHVKDGVATFRNLRIDRVGSDYSLIFVLYAHVPGTTSYIKTDLELVSPPFDVVVGLPVELAITQRMSDGVLDGQPNAVQPELELWDAGGNVVNSVVSGDVIAHVVPSLSVGATVIIDTSHAPDVTVSHVQYVTNSDLPMPLGVGALIHVQVVFTAEVRATGVPTLELLSSETGGPNGIAECINVGVWTKSLVFEYAVIATDSTPDLNYVSVDALKVVNAIIIDRNMRPALLQLPALDGGYSLKSRSDVEIDTSAPVISYVHSVLPGNGEYGTGEKVYVGVVFSRPVTVYFNIYGGSPYINVVLASTKDGSNKRVAAFHDGNNTDTITFLYTVEDGDSVGLPGIDVVEDINVNNGFIKHYSSFPTTDADVSMVSDSSGNNLASMNQIRIDTSVPVVDASVGVTSVSQDGTYAPGDRITLAVTFDKPVRVDGYPRLYLETGAYDRPAGYATGSGTRVLQFIYKVMAYDSTGGGYLDYRDATALSLNGGAIRRLLSDGSGGVHAQISLQDATDTGKNLANTSQLTIDAQPARVTQVSVTSPPASVTRGDQVEIVVSFTSIVIVDTTEAIPSLKLHIGYYDRRAYYTSGSGSQALKFVYTAMLGDDADTLDYRSINALVLDGSKIRKYSSDPTMDAFLILPTPNLAAYNIEVDPAMGFTTTVSSITADVDPGIYGVKQVITIVVSFSDEVSLYSGMPYLKVSTGALVPYAEGSGTSQLTFMYAVQAGEATSDLDKFDDDAIICSGACQIVNFNREGVDLSLSALRLQPPLIVVDTSAPFVVDVYSVSPIPTINDQKFVVGDQIDIVVEMSADVHIDPPPADYPEKAPTLVLDVDTLGRHVLCSGYYGSDKHKLLFEYIVQHGDTSAELMYVDTASLTLNKDQSAIKRYSTSPTTNAILTLPAPSPLGSGNVIQVDTTLVPHVVSVTSLQNDPIYRAGDIIDIQVLFSYEVAVSGSPFVWLDLGYHSKRATYLSGTGSKSLVFRYTIEEDDYSIDLDYIDRHSLDTSDSKSAIYHAATHPTLLANLYLPYPSTQDSLSYNKDITVDGRKPRVIHVAFVTAEDSYGVGHQIVVEITFSSSIVVIPDDAGTDTTPVLRFRPDGVSGIITRYGYYVSGSGTNTLRFQYEIETGDTSSHLDYAGVDAIETRRSRILTQTTNVGLTPTQSVNLHLNPPGGRLLGDTAQSIAFGRVVFTDLMVNQLGYEYEIIFSTQVATTTLITSSRFDSLYSAVYGLRSSPSEHGDKLGYSVDIDEDTLVMGAPGAQRPISAVQIITAMCDSKDYIDEIQTVTTRATAQPAVQKIISSADPGATIAGNFRLAVAATGKSKVLPADVDIDLLSVTIEQALGFGTHSVNIVREENTACECKNAYIWTITFIFAEGPLAPLLTISELEGDGATIGDGLGSPNAKIIVESTAISGTFTLRTATSVTRLIDYDISPIKLTEYITNDLQLDVRHLRRTGPSTMREYTWYITFLATDQLYDVPELEAQSSGLYGYQARVKVETLRDGLGRLSGFFRLKFRSEMFPSDETEDIAVTASDIDVENALEALTSINDVQVSQSSSINAYGGYSWTITFLQVNTRNEYGPVEDKSGTLPPLEPVTTTLVGGEAVTLLKGSNARIDVQTGGFELSPLTEGATNWGLPGENAGMASVFTRGENDWKQQGSTISAIDTRTGDLFGTSVGISGNSMIVGAPAAAYYGAFELQNLLCDADEGYFRIVYQGRKSSPIEFDATSMQLRLAIVEAMSVPYGDVVIMTDFNDLCGGIEITIQLRSGNHGDTSGNIPELVVDATGLKKAGVQGIGLVQEYQRGTFQKGGEGAKGLQCGAAYVFERNEEEVWDEKAKLTPPVDMLSDVTEFGSQVAIYNRWAVVTAPGAYHHEGRAFVYEYDSGSKIWSLFQILDAYPYEKSSYDRFGDCVAISGHDDGTVVIAIGAPGFASAHGSVFVFDLLFGVFQNRQSIIDPYPGMGEAARFGSSVGLDMSSTFTLVAGAPNYATDVGDKDSGIAVVLTRRSGKDTYFKPQQALVGSDTRSKDRFGISVAISKDTLLIGAHELYQGIQTIRKPVQRVASVVLDDGQSVASGSFNLALLVVNNTADNSSSLVITRTMAFDVSALSMQSAIENDLPLGHVQVRRDGPSDRNEFSWYITFTQATGNIPLIQVGENHLATDAIVNSASVMIDIEWAVTMPPILRSNVYTFTRNEFNRWTEQLSFFPRAKQYFSWFGTSLALHERTAIVGAYNLDTYATGSNSGGGFVYDLGILGVRFSSKEYDVMEGETLSVDVTRCNEDGIYCAMDVAAEAQLYVNYDTGDAFSNRESKNVVKIEPRIGYYQRLSMLEAIPQSVSSFYASKVLGQEPYPQRGYGRWLRIDSAGTANARNQFYGSSERRSLWIDSQYDYDGEADYATSSGELYFDLEEPIHSFQVATTGDLVYEDLDESIMLRLSLPGIWPSRNGQLWSTATILDDGDGGMGTQSYLDVLSPEESDLQLHSQFGSVVSIFDDANVAVVGAPFDQEDENGIVTCGAAYFYARKSGVWELQNRQTPSSCVHGMLFGASVAVDGSLGPVRAIVGAPGAKEAYIYLKTGNTWVEEAQLSHPDATSHLHHFGGPRAVGIYGNIAVVGAAGLESAYVYHRLMTGWVFDRELKCSDSVVTPILQDTFEQEYRFGYAVAINKRTIVVGAPFSDNGKFSGDEYHDPMFDRKYFGNGAVYVFYIEAQVQRIQLQTDHALSKGTFQLQVNYRGVLEKTNEIAYNATSTQMKKHVEDLSTLAFVEVSREGSLDKGFTWYVTFIGAIMSVPPFVPLWKGYGCDVCDEFSSSFVAAPAQQVKITEMASIGTWQEQARLHAPDGNPGDQFGASVDISNHQVAVGAPGSDALTTTTWNFETGDLTGWLVTGTAFDAQPTFGDNSYRRIDTYRFTPKTHDGPGQHSNHEGRYWIGTFEDRVGRGKDVNVIATCPFANDLCRVPKYDLPGLNAAGTFQGDGPQGSLTSQPFLILGSWMSFRLGGGCDIRVVYVELVVDGLPTYKATGRCEETMHVVTWNLNPYLNRTAQVRLVDASSSHHWGHINFDDVRFSWDVSQPSTPRAGAAYTFRRKAPSSRERCSGMNVMVCDWEFQARLGPGDKKDGDLFGFSVSIDDDSGLSVVGAPGQLGFDANNTLLVDSFTGFPLESVGSVYLFQRTKEVQDGRGVLLTPPRWTPKEIVKLQYTQKHAQSEFGYAAQLSKYSLVVGSPGYSRTPWKAKVGQTFAYDVRFSHVRFTAKEFGCVESNLDGWASLTIVRDETNVSVPLTIGYATSDGTAVAVDAAKYAACMKVAINRRQGCFDYQQVANEITFAAGETSKQLRIPIVDDDCFESFAEYFTVRLNVPGGEALVGEQYVARVRIDDDDFDSDACL